MTTPRISIGSISHGTCNPRDLIPAFLQALPDPGPALEACADSPLVALLYYKALDWLEDPRPLDVYLGSEECVWDLETITQALEDLAPPFTYFGALEGDGSDFGFWPSSGAIEHEQADPNSETHIGPEEPADPDTYAWLEINERGNLAYRERTQGGPWETVWSCV
jgi:hypothetical protein